MGGIRGYQAHQQAMAWSTMAVEQDPAARGALARVQGRLAGPEGVAAGLLHLSRQPGGGDLSSLDRLVSDAAEDLATLKPPTEMRV
jgi:hypothetical protein